MAAASIWDNWTGRLSSAITAALAAHVAAADPHTVYQLESEKAAASGYASLDVGTKVPTAQLGTGSASGSVFLRGDRAWAAPTAAQVGADATGTASGLLTAHVTAGDPHPGYQLESEKGTGSGYAGLSGGLVPTAQLGTLGAGLRTLTYGQTYQPAILSGVLGKSYSVAAVAGTVPESAGIANPSTRNASSDVGSSYSAPTERYAIGSTAQFVGWYAVASAQLFHRLAHGGEWMARFALGSLTTGCRYHIGLSSAEMTTASGAPDHLCLRFCPVDGDTTWQWSERSSSGTVTLTDTGITPSTAEIVVGLRLSGASVVATLYTVSGNTLTAVQSSTLSTALSTAAMGWVVEGYNVSTAGTKSIDISAVSLTR